MGVGLWGLQITFLVPVRGSVVMCGVRTHTELHWVLHVRGLVPSSGCGRGAGSARRSQHSLSAPGRRWAIAPTSTGGLCSGRGGGAAFRRAPLSFGSASRMRIRMGTGLSLICATKLPMDWLLTCGQHVLILVGLQCAPAEAVMVTVTGSECYQPGEEGEDCWQIERGSGLQHRSLWR